MKLCCFVFITQFDQIWTDYWKNCLLHWHQPAGVSCHCYVCLCRRAEIILRMFDIIWGNKNFIEASPMVASVVVAHFCMFHLAPDSKHRLCSDRCFWPASEIVTERDITLLALSKQRRNQTPLFAHWAGKWLDRRKIRKTKNDEVINLKKTP